MAIRMIVKVCSWCTAVQGCQLNGTAYNSDDDCVTCDKVIGCPIAENAHIFDATSSICDTCKEYHFPDFCG